MTKGMFKSLRPGDIVERVLSGGDGTGDDLCVEVFSQDLKLLNGTKMLNMVLYNLVFP
jgi:hypothetical protein